MNKPGRLGKGLEALFNDNATFTEEIQETDSIVEIELTELQKNPFQPRTKFDDEKIEELAQSIKEHGVFQPIIVTKIKEGKGYYIVAGERRFRACKKLGLNTIPAIIRDIDNNTMAEVALLENLQRENLTIVEEARAYKTLLDQYEVRQLDIAERTGKSRSHIANVLRILNLPESVQELLNIGEIEFGHAKVLLGLEDNTKIIDLANKIKSLGLTVRDLERLIKEEKEQKPKLDHKKIDRDPNLDYLEEQLCRTLGTKTKIVNKESGGRIVIDYTNDEDLNRILTIMKLEDIVNIIE